MTTLALPAGALAASDPLRRGLVGWYRMQGDVLDHSGHGNNGTVVNGPLTAAADKYGNAGGAYTWTYASSQKITLTNSSPIYSTTAPYSVAGWIKAPGGGKVFYSDFASTSGWAQFQIGSNTKFTAFIRNAATTVVLSKSSATTVNNSAWHHVAWTDNAGAAALYIDGALDATDFTYTPVAMGVALNRSTIGADINGNTQWDGSMSDVRLYNRVLTAAEVHTLYAATQRI